MKKEEQFYEDKSNLEQKLIDFIILCQQLGRYDSDEVSEVVINAFRSNGIEVDSVILKDE